ncbi:Hypothetical predicted protein [Olea europaea subsp. europaea]|uniref:Uncharacterized protein n=1 Tax=Olea europaea subsp. europaea TaxID=158383 RepID=A0A8S0U6X9_OLEEU|nr:Hypothetical predicted protein [Olea europaea subsp. europaea]
MEESKGRRRSPFCMPKLRGIGYTRKSNRLSPMSLLDRFREAVFKLIMFSALSKAQHNSRSSTDVQMPYYTIHDPQYSEAVADCIEFIKKSAITDDSNSGATNSMDSAT